MRTSFATGKASSPRQKNHETLGGYIHEVYRSESI